MLYGTAKVHKPGVPLRPILAMIGSPQHATAKWLADLLKPVLLKYSWFVVNDSFEFSQMIRQFTVPASARMCSFDIKSLYTNVPLEETIKICAKELYHSEIVPPTLLEESFTKLIKKVTLGVEFSFNEVMYKQKDGVAMGSPLGPVLANIFVGFLEEMLNIQISCCIAGMLMIRLHWKMVRMMMTSCKNSTIFTLHCSSLEKRNRKANYCSWMCTYTRRHYQTVLSSLKSQCIANRRLQDCILGGTCFRHARINSTWSDA